MSTEENKAAVRRYYEELWKGDFAALEEYLAPQVMAFGQQVTLDMFKDAISRHLTGFPDCQFVVEHLVAEGDIVAANTRFTGTNRGVFHFYKYGPWEPTGKSVDAREMDFFRLAGGKVVEMWVAWDETGFLHQLGVA